MTTTGEQERKKLAGRAGIVGAGTLLSRILGLVREVVVAAVFSRVETDAFVVAFTIPNALRQLLGEGAVQSAIVPVLGQTLEKDGEEKAKEFFARIRGVSIAILIVVTILGVAFAGPLTWLFASGYREIPGQMERATSLTRTVFPYIFLMGTAALAMAALNTKRRFTAAAFAPGLLNVAIVIAAFVLPGPLDRFGIDRAQALAIGALVGGVLQVVAQWPSLRAIGYAGRPILDFSHPGVREVLRRMGPMMFGTGIYYVDLVLSRRFLSALEVGSQSWFYWASRLCDFPQGIFVMAISTAALPSLSTLAARNELDEVAKTWAHGMRLALFVAIPCSVALAVLGDPFVATLFQHGAFDAISTHQTARSLVWQGGAIWTVAAVRQLVPLYYALGDTRTPVIVSALDLLAFIGLALGLRGSMGHAGISAAVAGSSFVQMLLLALLLRGKLPLGVLGEIGSSAGRTLAASIAGAAAAWGVLQTVTGPTWVPGIVAGLVFSIVFAIAAWVFRSPELVGIGAALRRRLIRS